jgi:hypothetical protein
MKFFKLSIVLVFMVAMSSAFASSIEARLDEGKKMLKDKYVSTGVVDVEKIRLPINTLFKTSVEMFDGYYTKAFSNSDYNNFYASVEGKSDEEIEQTYALLSPEMQQKIQIVIDANSDMNDSMVGLVLEIVAQKELLGSISPTSALSSLSMWDMPKALKAFTRSGEEVSFIYSSVVEINRINAILDQQANAI